MGNSALIRQFVGCFLTGVALGYGLGRHVPNRRAAPLKAYWNDTVHMQQTAAALRREQDKRRHDNTTQLRK
jgi:hypothetical protein